ncbi:M15 family metallopeptidase [Clostridium paraputrificum]|uniref:M15 family metallopeptidase n=1 Tax=Clostridium paraputrificum TaxID=29363 RepID=UPI003D333DE2
MKRGIKLILLVITISLLCWYSLESIGYNEVKENTSNTNNILVLVNKKNRLDKSFIPMDLIIPKIPFADEAIEEEKHVARIIKEPLEELVNAAKKDGIVLIGNSGYRSFKSQEDVYNNRVRSDGKKSADAYVAKPGLSEHQTGLCIDITNKHRYFVEGTAEADWLKGNCSKFGFVIRYPKGKKNITGIEYEPWHIRYVGKDVAKYIYDNDITLEEYLEK